MNDLPDDGSPYCGRLDDHEPHEWLGHSIFLPAQRVVRDCPGAPVIEGGNPARKDSTCAH